MTITLTNKETGKVYKPPKSYDYDTEGIVLGMDGKLYELTDNGACGDPECCGERTYYYQDVTAQYDIKVEA